MTVDYGLDFITTQRERHALKLNPASLEVLSSTGSERRIDEHGCQWSVICCKPSLANCEALRKPTLMVCSDWPGETSVFKVTKL
ncbi:hypothetical protein INR49_005419 [Caranx melampygus]|nr:hypothetical protein INR49_005419 [Caranx melampygus]